jgi:AraC-like DNA-binding protein
MRNPHPGHRPVTDHDRDQVRALHAQHLSRNQIARQLGRSTHTVTKLARELGLSFDRANNPGLQEATAARMADGRARRTQLALQLLEDAERLRQQLFTPTMAYNFGGKDNTYNEHQLNQPSFRDQQYLMHAIGIAVDRAVRLDAYDKIDESLSGVDAWLAAMTGTQ